MLDLQAAVPGLSAAESGYFAGYEERPLESSTLWDQLRLLPTWRSMKQLYEQLIKAELEAAATAAAAAALASAGSPSLSLTSITGSMDVVPLPPVSGPAASASAAPGQPTPVPTIPGLLARDDT
jgi:hypothetical protein